MFSDKEKTLQETQVSVAKRLGEAEHKAALLQAGKGIITFAGEIHDTKMWLFHYIATLLYFNWGYFAFIGEMSLRCGLFITLLLYF